MENIVNLLSIPVLTAVVYYLISLVVYFVTPVEERRLELAGEKVLDTLRTWSFSMKQTATLTNMKLYQSGVFLFGKKRRNILIPLDCIDSVEIASGRNYLWLALCISTVLSLLYGNSFSRYNQYQRDPIVVTITILAAALFFGIFWISGSRRITVRSKTAKITVEAATFSISTLVDKESDGRVFGFANRIQSLVVNPREGDRLPAMNTAPSSGAEVTGIVPSGTAKCPSCGSIIVTGSIFCEACGIPLS